MVSRNFRCGGVLSYDQIHALPLQPVHQEFLPGDSTPDLGPILGGLMSLVYPFRVDLLLQTNLKILVADHVQILDSGMQAVLQQADSSTRTIPFILGPKPVEFYGWKTIQIKAVATRVDIFSVAVGEYITAVIIMPTQ